MNKEVKKKVNVTKGKSANSNIGKVVSLIIISILILGTTKMFLSKGFDYMDGAFVVDSVSQNQEHYVINGTDTSTGEFYTFKVPNTHSKRIQQADKIGEKAPLMPFMEFLIN